MTTFYEWLIDECGRDDPIGDLADDAFSDPGARDGLSGDHESCRLYLILERQACPEAVMALSAAYGEFKRFGRDSGGE